MSAATAGVDESPRACLTCREEKPADAFHKNGKGRHPRCKSCRNAAIQADRRANPEKYREADRAKYKDNPASKKAAIRRYYEKNGEQKRDNEKNRYQVKSEEIKARVAAYRKENPHQVYAWNGARRARFKTAAPSWSDTKEIQAIYAKAAFLTACSGEPHHVDHIIPLQGKRVCGLHVADNLQVLTATENMKKGARHE